MLQVTLPDDVADVVVSMVQRGEYPTTDAAAAALIRRGLSGRPAGGLPPPPPALPPSERPIQVDPTDVNWAAGKTDRGER